MKRIFTVLAAALAVGLTGCAGGDYGRYAATLQAHSESEGIRIAAQAGAISEMVQVTETETAMEATLLAVIGMMQVERLQPVPLGITKPTTGNDVWQSFVSTLPMGYVVGGMVWQSSILASELSGTIIQDSAVTGSFNPTTSVTGSGSSSTAGTAAAPAPIIVEPFIVPAP